MFTSLSTLVSMKRMRCDLAAQNNQHTRYLSHRVLSKHHTLNRYYFRAPSSTVSVYLPKQIRHYPNTPHRLQCIFPPTQLPASSSSSASSFPPQPPHLYHLKEPPSIILASFPFNSKLKSTTLYERHPSMLLPWPLERSALVIWSRIISTRIVPVIIAKVRCSLSDVWFWGWERGR